MFGSDHVQKRVIYAANFMILMFSFVKMYIFTKPTITNIGFVKPDNLFGFLPVAFVIHMGIPSANYLSPIIQYFYGKDKLTKSIPWMFICHFLILWFEIICIYYLKSFELWIISCFLQQLIYSCIDLTADQIMTNEPNDKHSDQGYRSIGAFVGLGIPTIILITKNIIPVSISMFIVMGLILPLILITTSIHVSPMSIACEKTSTHGRISIMQFIITVLIVLAMSIPDGIGDAISREYANNYKNSSLVIIKYSIMAFAYGLTHPYIHQQVTRKFSVIGRYWPIILLFIRIGILYYFPELSYLGAAEIAFFVQSMIDTTSGTIIKNDIEQVNRNIFWSSMSTSTWYVPAYVANFFQEQVPPTFKKSISAWVENKGSTLDHKVFIMYASFFIVACFLTIHVLQNILKKISKKNQ